MLLVTNARLSVAWTVRMQPPVVAPCRHPVLTPQLCAQSGFKLCSFQQASQPFLSTRAGSLCCRAVDTSVAVLDTSVADDKQTLEELLARTPTAEVQASASKVPSTVMLGRTALDQYLSKHHMHRGSTVLTTAMIAQATNTNEQEVCCNRLFAKTDRRVCFWQV